MPQRASQRKLGKALNHTWLNKRNRSQEAWNRSMPAKAVRVYKVDKEKAFSQ
jgi:hypothetical protein